MKKVKITFDINIEDDFKDFKEFENWLAAIKDDITDNWEMDNVQIEIEDHKTTAVPY